MRRTGLVSFVVVFRCLLACFLTSFSPPSSPLTFRHRPMFPGKYQFKFIIDDQWTYSADHQTVADGTHINNCLEVLSRMEEEGSEKLRRYMSAGCVLTGGPGGGWGWGLSVSLPCALSAPVPCAHKLAAR